MPSRLYPSILAGLPHVKHFTLEKPALLTRLRLDDRLSVLHPGDRAEIAAAETLAAWSPATGPLRFLDDAEGANAVERIASRDLAEGLRRVRHRGIRGYLELRRDQRLVLMVWRRRRQGKGPEVMDGLDPALVPHDLARHLRRHWHEPGLRLERRHPWIPGLCRAFEEERPLELRRSLMETAWTRLGRLRDEEPLGLGAVAAFFFCWQIRSAWASHDGEASRNRFRELLDQALVRPPVSA